ncbi:MAG: type II toxin-antitoxin system RelE/ParE family toxin [Candidatus Uhrbacteria bacterium]|nr:type II toxin-antitoxin system RelE/ParE family toxin [Patescibacteria group bacterium]MBU1906998.1 type II toxin-antitoxin system RelE/ParE family toxin [Patescibacteria group bacterium]
MQILFFDNKLEKFVRSLDIQTSVRVIRTIELLEKFSNKLGLPHSRSLGKGLFELRVRGQKEIRILYVFHKNSIVLLHGFIKKSKQIPIKELDAAIQKKKQLDT